MIALRLFDFSGIILYINNGVDCVTYLKKKSKTISLGFVISLIVSDTAYIDQT